MSAYQPGKYQLTAAAFMARMERDIRECVDMATREREAGQDTTTFDELIRACTADLVEWRANHPDS